jgi:tetratricopeptide (TPR) repeat protein
MSNFLHSGFGVTIERWLFTFIVITGIFCFSSCQTAKISTHPSPEARIRALNKPTTTSLQKTSSEDSARISGNRIEQAKEFIHQGSLKQAISLLRSDIAHFPDHREAYVLLAGALFQSQQLAEAEKILFSAIQRWPEDSKSHLLMSYCLLDQGKKEQSLSSFLEALKYAETPTLEIAAHLGLASVYAEMKQDEQATYHYHSALAIEPELEEVLVNIHKELLWQEPVVASGEGFGGDRMGQHRKGRLKTHLERLYKDSEQR